MVAKPPSSLTTNPTWDVTSRDQLVPSTQRLRALALEMGQTGKADLAAQVNRAADAVEQGQSAKP